MIRLDDGMIDMTVNIIDRRTPAEMDGRSLLRHAADLLAAQARREESKERRARWRAAREGGGE